MRLFMLENGIDIDANQNEKYEFVLQFPNLYNQLVAHVNLHHLYK